MVQIVKELFHDWNVILWSINKIEIMDSNNQITMQNLCFD